MSTYEQRFWKKNWDEGLDDLADDEFDTTYVEMIEGTFEDFADRTALGFMGVDISFGELGRHANRFANALAASGFGKGDVVGINLPNVPECVIGLIGALRAGCIVSGVSPLLSAEQLEYQLNDLGSTGKKVALLTLDAIFAGRIVGIAANIPRLKLVAATSVGGFLPKVKQVLGKFMKKIPSGKLAPLPGIPVLDFHRDVLGSSPDSPPQVSLFPDDIGWIQYTGGTTGPPKGAMLSHRNVVHNILSINKWLGWEPGNGVLLSGFPIFHAAGLTVCECAIFFGWTQVLIPNPRDTDHICREIKRYRPTNMANVPSLYQMLMANPKFKTLDHSTLRTGITAAAPFPRESQVELERIIGEGKLLELYGMTETSPVSTMNPSRGRKKRGTVGMPFLNVECKLVDPATGDEVPLGEAGEICIRGPMVMQGYFNRPEETAIAIDADGYMHTGDVAVMDEDGYLTIVDRTKDMINVGGYKVFSSKVEEVLSDHPAVGLLALIGRPHPERPGSEIVKAYVQLEPMFGFDGNEEALKAEILRFAKDRCAPYEVPRQIEFIEEMPLTAVGKIDKKALRKQKQI